MIHDSLLRKAGPFPTLYKVSLLLREPHLTTWRRLQEVWPALSGAAYRKSLFGAPPDKRRLTIATAKTIAT
jgi:hypothetical protein